MYRVKYSCVLRSALGGALIVGLTAGIAAPASAAGYRVIANLTGFSTSDGSEPFADLVADKSGRLYGTALEGGQFGGGTVFRLTKTGRTWSKEILFNFPGSSGPKGGVLIGPSGELYGTTNIGGIYSSGTVYRLDQTGSTWTMTTLHQFNPTAGDGYYPSAGLTFGKNGLLYGTTTGMPPQDSSGSRTSPQFGTVFSISPQGDATEYAVIHVFGGTDDGQFPEYGRLLADNRGVLTGTTELGGKLSDGMAFQLAPPTRRQTAWTETDMHDFGALGDAVGPFEGVTRSKDGSFYGCATWGVNGYGAVYSLTPNGKAWNEQVIYSFGDQANDPSAAPACAVTADATGKLFGVSTGGGTNAKGAFFEVDPPAGDQTAWTEKVLHSFGSGDGQDPFAAPLKHGKLYYGTTELGGTGGGGTVYEVKP